MQLLISRFLIASFLPVAMLVSSCAPTPGMRLFRAEYRVDSKLLLTASYDESDSVPAADLWESLAEAPIFVDDANAQITPDPGNPLRATLTGDIEVRLVHSGEVLSTSQIKELVLVRAEAAEPAWHPALKDLEKITDAATF